MAVFCLAEPPGVVQAGDVAALRRKHLAALGKGGAVGQHPLRHGAAGGLVPFAGQHQHVGGQLQADFGQVGRAFALQDGHALSHFQRVADAAAQRLVHIGDERRDLAPVRRADGDHLARKLDGVVERFHKRAVAHRHIQQDGV